MINLIKNELCKIFHKKAIYVLAIISVCILLLNLILYKASDVVTEAVSDVYISDLEKDLSNFDFNSKDFDEEQYLSDKTLLDVMKLQTNYDSKSWEYSYIDSYLFDDLYCMNEAKINGDEENFNLCKDSYDADLLLINNGDWQYFIKEEINDYNELEKVVGNLNVEERINRELLQYRLDREVPYSNSEKSYLIDNYKDISINYERDKDKELKTYSDKYDAYVREKDYMITKYTLEHDINTNSSVNVSLLLQETVSSPIFLVLIVVLLISSSILSEEFNKGTIKQLLVKPYSRTKILVSKYITCIIMFILFLTFYLVASTLVYSFLDGFGSLTNPVLVYDFTNHVVLEMNIFKYILVSLLAVLPCYLILISFAFAVSTIATNSLISMGATLFAYFASTVVNAFSSGFDKAYFKFFPSLCWDLSELLYGGLSSYKYGNLVNSIMVSVITILLLDGISLIVFNKKNIKNQ